MALVPVLCTGAALAQDAADENADPEPPPLVAEGSAIPADMQEEFGAALARLDSNAWRDRADAAAWLRACPVADAVFELLLEADYLSREQRHWIISVLRERILTRRSGAIGIQMGAARGVGMGVVVDVLIAGFPAERVLRVGDRIVQVNDRAVFNSNDFQETIAAYTPGDTVTLHVVRATDGPDGAEQRFVTDLVLADASRLNRSEDQQSRLELDRRLEADALVSERSPAAVALRVPAFVSRVDRDPRVAELLSQRERIIAGELEVTPELLNSWRRIRDELRLAIMDRTISEPERRFREEVYKRFRELMPN